jgi:hypothetical protein
MNILIAAASFSSQISGLQRHAFNVVRCLLQLQEISAVHLSWRLGKVRWSRMRASIPIPG